MIKTAPLKAPPIRYAAPPHPNPHRAHPTPYRALLSRREAPGRRAEPGRAPLAKFKPPPRSS